MQLSHGIVVTLDLDGVIIHGNSMLESLSGYSMQELAGKDWFETFIPQEQRDDSRKEVLDKAGKRIFPEYPAHMRRQNGLLRERFNLIERNKELNCLYEISKLGADGDLDLKETLRKIVNLLPSGFQNPDKTHI
ncbi:PAS domain S-box protein, partial [Aduncisulcus paluster]